MLLALLLPVTDPLVQARAVVAALVNQARQEVGLGPLEPEPRLQQLGDAFCRTLLQEGGKGHFTADGVPPYLRALLAGSHGFHRQNVGSYHTSAQLAPSQIPAIAVELTQAMLAESPPQDGHRRTLLEPSATHLGVGLAWSSQRLVLSHEVSTQGAELEQGSAWCLPQAPFLLRGKLARPWQLAGVEVLWEPLPSGARATSASSYSYPPRKAWHQPVEFIPGSAVALPGAVSWEGGGRFTFRQRLGPLPGVQLLVIWGRRPGSRTLVPLALAGCVVSPEPPPPWLRFWAHLGEESKP